LAALSVDWLWLAALSVDWPWLAPLSVVKPLYDLIIEKPKEHDDGDMM
jgi:hypothetical protein